MRTRPVLSATAALAVLALGGASASAGTTAATVPAVGTGSSNLTVLDVAAGGHQLRVGGLSLVSDTLSGSPLAQVVLTPLVADGVAYGQQTVTPESSPLTVPSVTSPGALSSILSVATPALTGSATNAPSSHAGAVSLGSLKLLGISVPVAGSVDVGSSVSKTAGAVGQKTVTLKNLSLPSVADLLGALGLDLSALPVDTITDLVDQLDLVNDAVDDALTALDAASGDLDAAVADVTAKTAAKATADTAAATAASALTTATSALQTLIDAAAVPGISTPAEFGAATVLQQAAVEALAPGTGAAYTSYTDAVSASTAADAAAALAATALTTAEGLVTTLTAAVQPLIDTLQGAVLGLLDSTPLLSLDSLTVSSKAVASTAKAGGQKAEIVGGSITGLKVLGTDVLETALGASSVDATDLVGSVVTEVSDTVAGLTGTLSDVLSTVPGFPKLSIPAPQISVLTKATSTGVSGGFGQAATSIQGLRITIPAITLPTALALPGAASLPALSGVTQSVAGQLSSAPITVGLGTLSDQAAFRPATVPGSTPTGGTPGTTPPLAATGAPAGVALVAVLFLGGAVVLRRRMVAQA